MIYRTLQKLLRGAELPTPAPGGSSRVFITHPGEININPNLSQQDKLEAFKGWVYSAASAIVTDVGAAEYEFRRGEMEVDLPPELAQPNDQMSLKRAFEVTDLHMELAGEAYWHVITTPGSGRMLGFEVIYPNWIVRPVITEGYLREWEVRVPGHATKRLKAEDVIQFRFPHPTEPLRGYSPVEAFILSHELDMHTSGYGSTLMKHNAIPAVVLKTNQRLKDGDATKLREEWRQRQENMPGVPGVLGMGMDITVLGLTLDKLGLESIDKMTRDKVFAAYGVPASKRGLVEDVNRANADANDRTFKENVVLPRLTRLEDAVNEYLLPRLRMENHSFHFLNPVKEDRELIRTDATEMLGAGMIMVNDALEMVGKDPVPDGDVYYIPNNVVRVPAGQLETAPNPGQPGSGEERWTNILSDPAFELAEVRFVSTADKLERAMVSDIRRLFSQEQKLILQALREFWEEITGTVRTPEQAAKPAVLSRTKLDDAFKQTADDWLELLEGHAMRGVQSGWSLTSKTIQNAVDFSEIQEQALLRSRRWSVTKVKDITRTTAKEIRSIVRSGIRDGDSVDKVAEALRLKFDQWKGGRAATIARTEMTANINYGKFATARATRRKTNKGMVKFWVTIRDGNQRDTHDTAHGQRREVEDTFDVGGASLRFPGDTGAPAAEVINCRCTVTFKTLRAPYRGRR